MSSVKKPHLLVTGATGYVGGRIVPQLLSLNYNVRVLVRDPNRLKGRPWLEQVEVAQGDVLKPETLGSALSGIQVAYYLIHSTNTKSNHHQRDLLAAHNFRHAASEANLERIIYLSSLASARTHGKDFQESGKSTGDILREGELSVTEFRAAPIIGSGSLSFEMIRDLTERLPVMICPRWVYTSVQPIAIRNVVEYLLAALETPGSVDEIIEIGGPDVQSYADMMRQYAEERGLRRLLVRAPVSTLRLSSYWLHWMTPVPASIARPFITGLQNELVVRDEKAAHLFPNIVPYDYRTAVRQALAHLEAGEVESTWNDALATSQGDVMPVILTSHDGMMIEQRQRITDAPAPAVFQSFSSIGGERGWPYFNWAWRMRGMVDRLIGGVGLRRSRRDPDTLRVGDALDFWRFEAVCTSSDQMRHFKRQIKRGFAVQI